MSASERERVRGLDVSVSQVMSESESERAHSQRVLARQLAAPGTLRHDQA